MLRSLFAVRTGHQLTSLRRQLLAAALIPCALVLATRPVAGHSGLMRASPASGETVRTVPHELRLTFSESVEPAVARVELSGPRGPVEIGTLSLHPDSSGVLIAPLQGLLAPGEHTVSWQVVGSDGHPVRGQYTFIIAQDAEGLASPDPVPPSPAQPAAPATEPTRSAAAPHGFDAGSPAYAAIRWLGFIGLLGVVGAVSFRLIVLPLARIRQPALGEWLLAPAAARAALLGLGLAALLCLAAVLRLAAQSYALHGEIAPHPTALLLHTGWGTAWLVQALGAVLALVGFGMGWRGWRVGWGIATAGALIASLSAGLAGHAAAVPRQPVLAPLADGLHVLGAGGWLGTLLILLAVGVPAALAGGSAQRGSAIATLVNAFSPAALAFAALVVATGAFGAWLHVGSLPALWGTAYGRTLLGKLALFALVLGLGAYNWRRVRPSLGREEAAGHLRRSASTELVVGALLLAVTAALVAIPTPHEPPMDAEPAPEVAASP